MLIDEPLFAQMELPWVVWPESVEELETLQRRLAATAETVSPWVPPTGERPVIGGVFCAHQRGGAGPGAAGEPIWLGAVLMRGRSVVDRATVRSLTGAGYAPGLLALREGPALEAAARALRSAPDVLLVDATGRDHPRGCGLALHLGARLGIPTVGVTDRPLMAQGPTPEAMNGSAAELRLGGAVVGHRLRSAAGARPIAVHAGWRTSPEVALAVARLAIFHHRTPEPVREARRIARALRNQERGAASSHPPTP
jgi:deoxyribonuclease V